MWRALALAAVLAFFAASLTNAQADTRVPDQQGEVDQLAAVMLIRETVELLRQEGLTYAGELDQQMLQGQGGAAWQVQAGLIYNQSRMERILTKALEEGLTSGQIADVIAYFEADPGKRILKLEIEARVVMADPDAESLAIATFSDRIGSDDPRAEVVLHFMDVNDLVSRNVEGALNAEYQFLRGLAEGRGERANESDILSDVWEGVEESRKSINEWISAYLFLAYQPLDEMGLNDYIAFSETEAGQALNRALFAGFDVLYRELSYALGQAIAQSLQTSDI